MGLDMFLNGDSGKDYGYWRKANQIHGYLVKRYANGIDECQPITLNRDALVELGIRCAYVLLDNSKAMELLPPTEGFFFGSYEIDKNYFDDLTETVNIVTRALHSDENMFVYQASW